MFVDISEFQDLAQFRMLVQALWEQAPYAGFFEDFPSKRPQRISEGEFSVGWMEKRFDYLSGKQMKFSFEDLSRVNTKRYDELAQVSFASVVAALRASRV
jgi:hypothetical protein